MCWLDDKSSFVLDGDKQESSLCNKTLIKMCIKVQKYDSESDSNEKYMQQLSSVIRELETEQKIETNGVKAKPTENETVSGSDGTSWDTGKDPKYRKFCEENVIILKAAEKACDLFQNQRYAEAVVEFESALKGPTREPDLSMIQYSISRSCYFTDTYENLLKGLQILEKQRSDYVEILTMFEGRGNDPFNSGILELARSTVPAIFYALSQHLYRFKQYDEALRVLKEANKHLKTAKAPTKFRDSSTKVWKKVTTAFPELLPNEAAKRKIDELFNTLKNLPKPDAACFHPECININQHEHIAPKKEIYFNKDIKDVDFKGMAILKCEDKCVIAYHATCWKEHKRTMEKIKYDKDFLGKKCYTPDCGGKVIELRLVRETGKESIVKAEEEVKKLEDVKKSKAKAVSSTAAPTDTFSDYVLLKGAVSMPEQQHRKHRKHQKHQNHQKQPRNKRSPMKLLSDDTTGGEFGPTAQKAAYHVPAGLRGTNSSNSQMVFGTGTFG
jgi:tetratricopeptide (TPR) repeat protein